MGWLASADQIAKALYRQSMGNFASIGRHNQLFNLRKVIPGVLHQEKRLMALLDITIKLYLIFIHSLTYIYYHIILYNNMSQIYLAIQVG